MHIDLQKHHVNYLTPIVEARMRVLKNRILKEKKDDLYDYEPAQIELKICEISDEYSRLNQCLETLYRAR